MRRAITTALALALAGNALVLAGDAEELSAAPQERERPNIVVIMTDDQDVESLRYMPRVNRILAKKGVTFDEHSVVFPLCCPSRSGYLSGQVGHNNNVRGNAAPEGGYTNLDATETLPVWLSKTGYATTHLGKYPNGYQPGVHQETLGVPPGYTEWHGAVDPTTYLFYDYVLNENGVNTPHGATEADYQTDVLTDKAVDFIERRSEGEDPFFLDVAYLAPHWEIRPGTSGDVGDLEGQGSGESSIGVAPVPAKRHLEMFADAKAPRGPAFNEKDVSDKPTFVRETERLSKFQIDQLDRWYRKRLASLQSVDEGVKRIVDALAQTGELDNTYIVFTADNGWLQGEHRIALTKVHAYNESSVVPMIVRGPGLQRGEVVEDPTSHVDLPATIVDLAGAKPSADHKLDGMSLRPYFQRPHSRLGRAVFQETSPNDGGYYSVRTGRWKYVEYNNGDRELYDLVDDPYQLESLHKSSDTKAVREKLSELIARFKKCAGKDCVITGFQVKRG